MRLTDDRIKSLPLPPAGERIDIRDDALPGLVLRVASTGIKTFTVYRRLKGHNPVRVTIGRWPAVSVKTARERARREIDALASGTDTRPARRAAKAKGMTVRSILEEYLRLHARRHKAAYQRDLRRMINAELSPWLTRRLRQLMVDGCRMAPKVRLSRRCRQGGRCCARSRFAWTSRPQGARRQIASEALGTLRLGQAQTQKTIVRICWRGARCFRHSQEGARFTMAWPYGLRRSSGARRCQLDLCVACCACRPQVCRHRDTAVVGRAEDPATAPERGGNQAQPSSRWTACGRGTKTLHEAVAAT